MAVAIYFPVMCDDENVKQKLNLEIRRIDGTGARKGGEGGGTTAEAVTPRSTLPWLIGYLPVPAEGLVLQPARC